MSLFGFHNKFKLGLLVLAASGLFVLSGCLGGGGSLTNLPTDETALVKMKIRLGQVDSKTDADPKVNLSKGSSIRVQKLMVKFTSNLGDTVSDTVYATGTGVGADNFLSDSVLINVNLRALRWWNVEIETRDQNDSVVHQGQAGPFASKGGQNIDIEIPQLDSRYLMYEAHYTLPHEIYSNGIVDTTNGKADTVKQKIYFHKLVLEIDNLVTLDSSSLSPAVTAPGSRFIFADDSKIKGAQGKLFFKPNRTGIDTATHVQAYEYVKAGSHTFKMSAYGYLEGDSVGGNNPRLLFQGQASIKINQTGTPSEEEVKLDYKGPGSEAVKNDSIPPTPGTPNWNGIQMTVKLGRVKGGKVTVGFISGVDL
jgi:hypothetical protein